MVQHSPKSFYEAYSNDFTSYEVAAKAYHSALESVTANLPTPARSLEVRAKDPLSVYKKLHKKTYSDPWSECGDLVGARIIVALSSDKDRVIIALREAAEAGLLHLLDVDDKELVRDPKVLSYSGLHAQVQLPDVANQLGTSITCEVQIRTIAEHTWAETEHQYIYKGPEGIPNETRRIFSRLLALVELLDHELDRGVTSVSKLDSFARLHLAKVLEREFRSLYSGAFNTTLTHEAVEYVHELELYETAQLIELVQAFAENKRPMIQDLLERHGPTAPSFDVDTDWILSQPECLLYLAILEENAFGLGVRLANTDLYEIVRPLAVWTSAAGFLRQD